MEPADYGREHDNDGLERGRVGAAAMEPVGYGREHPAPPELFEPVVMRPQWSPPVMGESTVPDCGTQIGNAVRNGARLLWGESTPAAVESPVTAAIAPQWSPPVMGGSTRRPGGTRHAGTPAMEPVRYWRENVLSCPRVGG